MSKSWGRRKQTVGMVIPPYTSSLDAVIPAENVVLSHFMPEIDKWFVASQASDGKVFTSLSKTEPLARRAAGLRTLAHLKARANGEITDLTVEEIEAARKELTKVLSTLAHAVHGFNGEFPVGYAREVVLIHLRAAADLVDLPTDKGMLAKWVAPPLVFLSGAFASGIIGEYAKRALELLEGLLAA